MKKKRKLDSFEIFSIAVMVFGAFVIIYNLYIMFFRW